MLIFLGILVLVFSSGGTASVGIRVTWEQASQMLPPALRDQGIASACALVLGPLVSALAAYFPARRAASLDVIGAARGERVMLL